MTPAIGSADTGMQGVGSALAAGQPPAAGGSDPQQQQLVQTMGAIRTIADQVKQLAAAQPSVAQEAQQIQELLKQMVVKSAQPVPVQTDSSMAVPGGGGGM